MKKLTNKQRNRLLLLGAILGCYAIYTFAIRNTLETRNQCLLIQQQIDSATDAPARLLQLKENLRSLESITGKQDSTISLHEKLLGTLTNYCSENGIILRDYASPIRYHQQEWLVETHPIVVEGAFIPVLKLVHQLEKEKMGKVVSVDFHSNRDNKTNELSLLCTIYVQNIIHEKS